MYDPSAVVQKRSLGTLSLPRRFLMWTGTFFLICSRGTAKGMASGTLCFLTSAVNRLAKSAKV